MKFTPEYFIAAVFIVIGILNQYDKRTNWAIIILGLFLVFLKIGLDYIGLSVWWPLGLIIGVTVLVILMFRFKKGNYNVYESDNDKNIRRYALIFAIGLMFVLLTSAIMRPSIKIVDNKFKVGGVFGFEYPISDIVQIDTLQGYPIVGMKRGGSAFAGVYKGSFELEGYGLGKLFIKKGI